MIAIARPPSPVTASVQEAFVAELPRIREVASYILRYQPKRCRHELMDETIAYAWRNWVRLVQRGKDPSQFTTILFKFAAYAVLGGRRVGQAASKNELLVDGLPRRNGAKVESLDYKPAADVPALKEILVEKRAFRPPDVVAARIDIAAWLKSLRRRYRRIAVVLASGQRACDVATQFRLSRCRISQIRGELRASWEAFQGEAVAAAEPA